MKPRYTPLIALILLQFTLATAARSLDMLYDFSSPKQLDDWSVRSPDLETLKLTNRYATPKTRSMLFTTPKWEAGMNQWPAMTAEFMPRDFSKYDRLVIEMVNPTPAAASLRLFVTDSKTPLRNGLKGSTSVPPLSRQQFVVDISETNPAEIRKINLADVAQMQLWMTTPSADVSLYIDRIYLAGAKEELPEAAPALIEQVVALFKNSQGLKDGRALVKEVDGWLEGAEAGERPWLEAVKAETAERVDAVESVIDGGQTLDAEQRQALLVDLDNLSRYAGRIESMRPLRQRYAEAVSGGEPARRAWGQTLVATASSMQKVLPRDVALPSSVQPAATMAVQMAQNEREGFQVVVLPFVEPLKGVAVEVGELTGEGGERLDPGTVTVEPVGYVKTWLPQHPLGDFGQYVGWWPDPMLPFLDQVDVERGDAQSFYIRIRTDKNTPPGTYRGTVRVTAADVAEPYSFDLEATVQGFALPDRSPLPLAMTFEPHYNRVLARSVTPGLTDEEWDEQWQSLKFDWADFLADHWISYDNLYRNGPGWPDFEVLDHLESRGALDIINLGRFGLNEPDAFNLIDQTVAEQRSSIEDAYAKAKQRGWLDRTYIYGFDERPKENFPLMERFVGKLQPLVPGVKVATTAGAYWDYWGEAEGIDVWCPILSNWDPQRVESYKKQGKDVWWYVCIASPPPYPNVFIDQDVIDTRVMMGPMTAKYRPDGFLYYVINRWSGGSEYDKNDAYITTGPFTEWNPKSFRESHGDGNMTYPGPEGKPLPNLRLENFRDGLEDYAYVLILEDRIREVQSLDKPTAAQRQWVQKAEAALEVPAAVVKATNSYTKDPADVAAYRAKLAEAITTAATANDQ